MLALSRTLMVTVTALALAPANAVAAGFGLITQSAVSGGTANAGTAANSHDPATVFLNPAGMVRNPGQTLAVVGHLIDPAFDFSGTALPATERGNGADTSRVDGADPVLAPAFYYMVRIHEDWALGLAVNAPFGSQTDFGSQWVGRYNAIESSIAAININPAIAYRINHQISVGLGINAQYFDATLSNMVEAGAAAAAAGFPVEPTYDGENDILTELEGDSWSTGINAGLLWDLNRHTHLGLAWRSKIRHTISGDLRVVPQTEQAQLLATQGGIENTGARTHVDLPESVTLSLKHQPGFASQLHLLADAQFTRWSRVDTVTIDAGLDENNPELVLNFQNSWRGALGATWDQSEQLQLRAGVAFEESAVRDRQQRTPRIPDNHRRWASIGAGYQFANGLQLDASYSRLFISDTGIDNDSGQGNTLQGTFDSSADVLSAQATFRF